MKRWQAKELIPCDEIRAAARRLGVPGWLSAAEATLLYDLAEEYSSGGPILEIGCYCGLSTAYLAAPGRQPVYSVDPHEPDLYNPTQVNLLGGRSAIAVAQDFWAAAGVADRIVPVVATSVTAAGFGDLPQIVGVLFIDADHRYDAVAADLAAWAQRVMPGGVIAMHDWGERGDQPEPWGVQQAGEEFLAASAEFEIDRRAGSLQCLRRAS